MTDRPGSSRHVLRPSISGALPPIPERAGESLRVALGFVRRDGDGTTRARVYAYPDPSEPGDVTQFDDLAVGDRFRVRHWEFVVAEISEDAVALDLAPEGEHA